MKYMINEYYNYNYLQVSFPIQADKENYGNKNVMELFLPVAVQFLHKGNREISRHMARYLSLAAVHHATLLKPHVQTIMDSIMSGKCWF
jgi:hypothetical protein